MTVALPVTLGILAGGRGTRLGGRDKAWIERDGMPLVVALANRMAGQVGGVLVSANAGAGRYAGHGLCAIPDRVPGDGPMGGLQALAEACDQDWLLTLPVDVVSVPEGLPAALLHAASGAGAFAEDDDGSQPLVALWRVAPLRAAVADALARGELAVHALQSRLGFARVRFPGARFGNINTPQDLAALTGAGGKVQP